MVRQHRKPEIRAHALLGAGLKTLMSFGRSSKHKAVECDMRRQGKEESKDLLRSGRSLDV